MASRRRAPRNTEARLRAAHAVSLMRTEHASLTKAARVAHTRPATVRRHFSESLRREQSRYVVARADREPFAMVVVSTEAGVTDRVVRGSHKRQLLGSYHNAVRVFMSPGGGDPAVLAPFAGKKVAGLALVTDPDALEEIWRQGQLDYLDIYALAG